MKHPRKIIKAQTANAVLLSLFTAFSPSQVFGSSFASTDANEYLFKEYVPNHKRIHSAPIEHVLRKELEDFVGKGDYAFFSQETEITWNVWTEGNILGNSVATHGKNLIFKADKGSFVLTPESVSVKGFGSVQQSRLDIKTASIFRRERRLSSINRSLGFWMPTRIRTQLRWERGPPPFWRPKKSSSTAQSGGWALEAKLS